MQVISVISIFTQKLTGYRHYFAVVINITAIFFLPTETNYIYTSSLRVYNYTDHFSWELVNLGWVWVIIFDQNLKLRLFWTYSPLGMPSQIKFEISISIHGYWLLHWLINEYSYSLTNIFVFCFVKKGFYCSYFIILKGK